MTNYTICLGSTPIAIVYGIESACEVYLKTRELAELLSEDCYCVQNGTGEIIASYYSEEE